MIHSFTTHVRKMNKNSATRHYSFNILPPPQGAGYDRLNVPTRSGIEARRPLMSPTDRNWLERFEAYVRQHYAHDTLSVPGLAREFAMSESTLLRQLKRLMGLSPVQYLQEVRFSEARRMLETRTCDSIAQAASKVGYDNVRSFSRSFRARFGKLPSELLRA